MARARVATEQNYHNPLRVFQKPEEFDRDDMLNRSSTQAHYRKSSSKERSYHDYNDAQRTQKFRTESSYERSHNATHASNHSQERNAAQTRQPYHNMDLNHDLSKVSD